MPGVCIGCPESTQRTEVPYISTGQYLPEQQAGARGGSHKSLCQRDGRTDLFQQVSLPALDQQSVQSPPHQAKIMSASQGGKNISYTDKH